MINTTGNNSNSGMIRSESCDAVFNEEQKTQIDAFKIKMLNLQDQTSILMKNISALKSESLRLQKEKDYFEGLVVSLKETCTDKRDEIFKIRREMEESNQNIRKNQRELADLKSQSEIIKKSLSDKESELRMIQGDLDKRSQDLSAKFDELASDREKVESNKRILAESLARLK